MASLAQESSNFRDKPTTNGAGDPNSPHPTPEGPTESAKNIFDQTPTVSDIGIQNPDSLDFLHRRGLHDISSIHNLMSNDVRRTLNVDMDPYNGKPSVVAVPGGEEAVPLGQVRVAWHLKSNKGKTYIDSFLVVETEYFDVILGEQIIREHQLSDLVGANRRAGGPR
ncbi:MAG: hypothetical protein M1839_006054 [Geoglossum umbratile]|nr:MAG: hypothetical protein M1839_006054 [Geoglossum umbratile]